MYNEYEILPENDWKNLNIKQKSDECESESEYLTKV